MLSEHVWAHVFLFFNWMLALAWLRHATAALRGMPKLPDLLRTEGAVLTALASNDGPNVTVIVPACNEEATIRATLRSLLASTGLQLEIVAVDDRSSDRTVARMDAVAAEAQAAGGPRAFSVYWLGSQSASKRPYHGREIAHSLEAAYFSFSQATRTALPGQRKSSALTPKRTVK